MNKISNLTLSGVMMALAGVSLLAFEQIGIGTAKFLIPALFIIGGVFAILFSKANPQHKIANQYHMMQGIGMIAFALLIIAVPQTLSEFLKYVTYFIIFFGMIEILFAFMVLNSDQKLSTGILVSRFVSGFASLIGGVLLLVTSISDQMSGLVIAGVLTLIGGLAFIMFSFRLKKLPAVN